LRMFPHKKQDNARIYSDIRCRDTGNENKMPAAALREETF